MPMLRLSLRLYATHPLETLRLYILSRLHTTRCHGDPPPHGPQLDNAALSSYTQHTRTSWRRRGVAIHEHPHTGTHGHEWAAKGISSSDTVHFTHGVKHRKSRRLEHPRTRTQTYALRRLTYTPQVNHTVTDRDGTHNHDGVTSCYAIPTRSNRLLLHAHTTHDKSPYAHVLHAPHAHDSEPSGAHRGRGRVPPPI